MHEIFTIVFLCFLVSFSFASEDIYKKPRHRLTASPSTFDSVSNTPLRVIFSTLFSVFRNAFKHDLSCLIRYITLSVIPCTVLLDLALAITIAAKRCLDYLKWPKSLLNKYYQHQHFPRTMLRYEDRGNRSEDRRDGRAWPRPGTCFSKAPETFRARKSIA